MIDRIAILELKEPFPPNDIKWRLGATNQKKNKKDNINGGFASKGIALAYVDARLVMQRLDDVIGPENWKDSYSYEEPRFTGANTQVLGRVTCTLSIKIGEEWVSKSDGAGETFTEGEKGGISDAFKRAGVKWGIGRYLYSLPNTWVDIGQYGKFTPPQLPKFESTNKKLRHDQTLQKEFASVHAIKLGISDNDYSSAAEAWFELSPESKENLWLAPTKGGIFTTSEREIIKTELRAIHYGEK